MLGRYVSIVKANWMIHNSILGCQGQNMASGQRSRWINVGHAADHLIWGDQANIHAACIHLSLLFLRA